MILALGTFTNWQNC